VLRCRLFGAIWAILSYIRLYGLFCSSNANVGLFSLIGLFQSNFGIWDLQSGIGTRDILVGLLTSEAAGSGTSVVLSMDNHRHHRTTQAHYTGQVITDR